MTLGKHHVPPQCYEDTGTFIVLVPIEQHRAYHTLFGIPRTLRETLDILAEKHRLHRKMKLPSKEQKAFCILFRGIKSLKKMESIIRKTWWTPHKKRKVKQRPH
jgi:hypothetical protein